jgi:subtilisin family serine protease
MSAQAVASVLPEFDSASSSVDPVDQVDVTTFADSTTDDLTTTAAAAAIGDSYGLDGTGQTIAIIDTGIAFDHVALGGGFGEGHQVVGGYDFAENDANPYDDGPTGFHGTHVAGIVGSNDLEYRGVAPGADLVALRVFDDTGATKLEWIEQSLQWVHENLDSFENPITTVNLSLGTSPNESYLEVLNDELQQLKEDGVFISVAAGNSFGETGAEQLAYPASSQFVVPVASHDGDGSLSDFSQRASHVLTAPGENITSTVPDHLFFGARSDSFLGTSGTSQAAPYVAAASALLRQANEIAGVFDVDQDLLYDQFISTADSIYDSVTQQNYSQINLAAALESVLGDDSPPSTPTPDATVAANEGDLEDPVQTSPTQASLIELELTDGVLKVHGSSADDHVSVTTTEDQEILVSINGQSARFHQDDVEFIVFNGQAGDDSVEVKLSGTDDQVQILQNRIEIRNQQFSLRAFGIEDAAIDNGDGDDSLYVEGSEFEDVVKASGRSVLFENAHFAASGGAFRSAYVLGQLGNDRIELEGSTQEDRFAHGEERSFLRSQQLELTAKGFENVTVNGNGGADIANIIGTSAEDRIAVDQNSAEVTGGRSDALIKNFERTNVIDTDGNDRVTLNGSGGDEKLHSRDNAVLLVSDKFTNYVRDFGNLTVNASGGNDEAYLTGSAGDDHLLHTPDATSLNNAEGEIRIEGYDLVVGRSTGGNDTAEFIGSDQRETYFASADTVQSTARSGDQVRTIGFDESTIDGGGGNDAIGFRGSDQNETLRINFDDAEFETTMQLLRMTNVQNSRFDGGGGEDHVEINDLQSLDLLSSIGEVARAVLSNHTVTFSDVDSVEANAVDSAIAAYDLESVDFEYDLNGNWIQRNGRGS